MELRGRGVAGRGEHASQGTLAPGDDRVATEAGAQLGEAGWLWRRPRRSRPGRPRPRPAAPAARRSRGSAPRGRSCVGAESPRPAPARRARWMAPIATAAAGWSSKPSTDAPPPRCAPGPGAARPAWPGPRRGMCAGRASTSSRAAMSSSSACAQRGEQDPSVEGAADRVQEGAPVAPGEIVGGADPLACALVLGGAAARSSSGSS